MTYIIKHGAKVVIDRNQILSGQDVVASIQFCNGALRELYEQTMQNNINIFEALGLKNLSGLVGEYFVQSVYLQAKETLRRNLHQDGYPDLCLVDTSDKRAYFDTLYTTVGGRQYPISKEAFSPYKYGGIEIKATCGTTPPATVVPKPLIGQQRIGLLEAFDWKAHHRDTNNLLSILWDFVEGFPVIVACFYAANLTVGDWGEIVQPREEGGHTTSVSIIRASGRKKLCDGWIAVLNNDEYVQALSKRKWIGYRVEGECL